MGCDDLTLQGRLKQSNLDIRFSATTPFYFRPRQARPLPREAARAPKGRDGLVFGRDKRGRSRKKRRERRKAVTGLCSAATSAAAPARSGKSAASPKGRDGFVFGRDKRGRSRCGGRGATVLPGATRAGRSATSRFWRRPCAPRTWHGKRRRTSSLILNCEKGV